MIKTYSELMKFDTYLDRLKYLKLDGYVGQETFGFERYLNQKFYRSSEWRNLRDEIFIRDNGCDLAIEDRPIHEKFYIHHMNPISVSDIRDFSEDIVNPEYLITVTKKTHDLIHYGSITDLKESYTIRKPNDTRLW